VAFLQPGSGRLRVQRIVARTPGGWLVRGDRHVHFDGMIQDSFILGRVTTVERRGRQVGLTRGPFSVILARLSRRALELRRMLIQALKRSGLGRPADPPR
jgi:hypothetical protein